MRQNLLGLPLAAAVAYAAALPARRFIVATRIGQLVARVGSITALVNDFKQQAQPGESVFDVAMRSGKLFCDGLAARGALAEQAAAGGRQTGPSQPRGPGDGATPIGMQTPAAGGSAGQNPLRSELQCKIRDALAGGAGTNVVPQSQANPALDQESAQILIQLEGRLPGTSRLADC